MRAKHVCGLTLAVFLGAGSLIADAESTPLIDAVKNDDQTAVRTLLKQHGDAADVNTPDTEGMTALNWAAYEDHFDVAKLLLAAGANAKTANRFGVSALHSACTFSDVRFVSALLSAGADPNAVRGEGDTPLMVAAHVGNPEVAKALLDHGAKADARDGWLGETPLMIAVAGDFADFAQILIDHGADVNAASTTFRFRHRIMVDATVPIDPVMGGLSPLLFAARQGALQSGEILVAAGAKVNAQDPEYGLTPLLISILNYHFDFAKFLILHGAGANDGSLYAVVDMRTGPSGHTGLPPTFQQDTLEMMKLLLDKGADPGAAFTKRYPPAEQTARKMLVPGMTPFYTAAKSVDLPAMHLLLERGAKTNIATRDGTTSLMAVANAGGAGPFAVTANFPPEGKLREALQLCLDNGIDINAVNAAGNTALHYAAGLGSDVAVQFLMDHGAKFDIRNRKGRTPLQWAQGFRPGGIGNLDESGQAPHESTVALITKLMGASATAQETSKGQAAGFAQP